MAVTCGHPTEPWGQAGSVRKGAGLASCSPRPLFPSSGRWWQQEPRGDFALTHSKPGRAWLCLFWAVLGLFPADKWLCAVLLPWDHHQAGTIPSRELLGPLPSQTHPRSTLWPRASRLNLALGEKHFHALAFNLLLAN